MSGFRDQLGVSRVQSSGSRVKSGSNHTHEQNGRTESLLQWRRSTSKRDGVAERGSKKNI
jgi:hypothetical protein